MGPNKNSESDSSPAAHGEKGIGMNMPTHAGPKKSEKESSPSLMSADSQITKAKSAGGGNGPVPPLGIF